MFDSVQPHRWQPTRLPCPWDSPGKNTGVGCHFLLQCMKVKSEVAQLCPTLSDPWTAAYQAPPSMGFSRQEYWSGVPLPSPQQKSRYFLILQQISIAQRKRFISRLIGNVDFSSFQVNNLEILHTPSNTTQPVPSINRFWYNESESEVTQSCPTLSDPMDCSPPGSSIHGIFQARVLEWGAITFFKPLINSYQFSSFLYFEPRVLILKNTELELEHLIIIAKLSQ